MRAYRLVIAVAIVGLGGCASSVTVKQSGQLADAGIAYGSAAQEVLGLTRDRYLDWESSSLLEELPDRPGCKPAELVGEQTPSADCESLITDFTQQTDNDQKLVDQFAQLDEHAEALSRYFQALKTLANFDAATSADNAADRLIDRINGLSDKLEGKAAITPAQKEAWSKLAGLVGNAIKAHHLKERLTKDAAAIGRAIDVQDGVLAASEAVLKGMDDAAREEAFLENVRTPYLTHTVSDPRAWRQARYNALFPGPEIAQLRALRGASQSLHDVWADILSGSGSAESAAAVFDDIAKALKIIDDVRRAQAARQEH